MKRMICLAALGIIATGGCAAAKEPLQKQDSIEATATIEAIDPESRLLVIRGPDGIATIAAGPEVRNFDQIRVGDKVKVTYTAAIAAAITKSKAKPTETYDAMAVTAPLGSKPAAAVGQTITTTVKIESVETNDRISLVGQVLSNSEKFFDNTPVKLESHGMVRYKTLTNSVGEFVFDEVPKDTYHLSVDLPEGQITLFCVHRGNS